jgi:hypothetical protein
MAKRAWVDELSDEAQSVWSVLRAFWVQDIWPLLMTFWIFFALGAPIIFVILVLWYLDSIGWQSGAGFYTIGSLGFSSANGLA